MQIDQEETEAEEACMTADEEEVNDEEEVTEKVNEIEEINDFLEEHIKHVNRPLEVDFSNFNNLGDFEKKNVELGMLFRDIKVPVAGQDRLIKFFNDYLGSLGHRMCLILTFRYFVVPLFISYFDRQRRTFVTLPNQQADWKEVWDSSKDIPRMRDETPLVLSWESVGMQLLW